MIKLENINNNYNKFNEVLKDQLELFDTNGNLTKENNIKFFQIEKELNIIADNLYIDLHKITHAKDKDGNIYSARHCQYSICAVEVDGYKMSQENNFNNYVSYTN